MVGAEVMVESYIYGRVHEHDFLEIRGYDAVIGIIRRIGEHASEVSVKSAKGILKVGGRVENALNLWFKHVESCGVTYRVDESGNIGRGSSHEENIIAER